MPKEIFDFYDKTSLKSYNLDKTMQYQLNILGSLDVFTRQHSENVASVVCRICQYLHCTKSFTEYCTICAYLHDIGKQFIPPSILPLSRFSLNIHCISFHLEMDIFLKYPDKYFHTVDFDKLKCLAVCLTVE